jgi:hypothetical protein
MINSTNERFKINMASLRKFVSNICFFFIAARGMATSVAKCPITPKKHTNPATDPRIIRRTITEEFDESSKQQSSVSSGLSKHSWLKL